MPVIVVTAPALPDAAAETRVLTGLAGQVAAALSLAPTDVIAVLVRAGTQADGAGPVAPWPTVVLHGSPRPATAQLQAEAAARRVVAAAWGVSGDRVWTQWLVRSEPAESRP